MKFVEKTCELCGTKFLLPEKWKHIKTQRFCSASCHHEARRRTLPDDTIRRLYVDQKKSTYAIGALFGVAGSTITSRLIRMGIERRKPSSRRGALNAMFGRHHSESARNKMRAATITQFSTQEARDRHAALTAKQIEDGRTGKSKNKVERELAEIMGDMGIPFVWQHRVGRFVYDFFVPTKVLIECDGSFWHADPRYFPNRETLTVIQQRNLQNDAKKTAAASALGFTLIRVWEHDVLLDRSKVEKQLSGVVAG